MGIPAVVVSSGGLAITEAASGLPMTEATNGHGIPVRFVASGGLPVSGIISGPSIQLSTIAVPENSPVGTVVGTLSVINGTGTYSFTLTDSAGGKFVLAGTNNSSLRVNGTLDYETTSSYSVTVSASNGGAPIVKTFTIIVTDVPGPIFSSAASVSIPESTVLAHTLTANESATWALVGGADQARFELSGATLRWLSNGVKDYEVPNDADLNNTYVVTVRATSVATGETTNQTITVTVTDVASPIITSAPAAAVAESATLLHLLTADQSVTWALVGGADQARFELSGASLRWLGNGSKNYEGPDDADLNNIYLVQVRATSSATGETAVQSISVTVTDVAAPVITSLSVINVAENATLSHALTANQSVTWELIAGADQARFELSGSTLRWFGDTTKDFDTPNDADSNNVYIVVARATSTVTGETADQIISVSVSNLLEITLAALTLSASTIVSASPENTSVGTLSSVTSGSTLTMTDSAGGRFKLAGNSVVAGATATNFGTATSHSITVSESHPDGNNSPRNTLLSVTVTASAGGEVFTFTDIRNNQVFQRSTGGNAPVRASGTYSGFTPSGIQVRVIRTADSSVHLDWTTIAATIAGGNWSCLPGVACSGSMLRMEVRPVGRSDLTKVGATVFGSGLVFACHGQSNMGAFIQSGTVTAGDKVFLWNDTDLIWEEKGIGGTFLQQMKTATGFVCGAINGSIGATGIPFLSDDQPPPPAGTYTGGGGLWRFYEIMARAGVTDWEMVLWNQGEGDVNATEAEYAGHFAYMQTSMAAKCGRAIAQMPMVLWSLTTFGNPDDGTNTDANWSRIRATHFHLPGLLTNVHFSHSMMDGTRNPGDAYHLDGASSAIAGDRLVRTVKSILGLSGGAPAHFEITGGDVLTGTTTRLTVTLVGGATDITPSASMTGFEVSGDNGATWISATGARTDATHVTLTHASIATTSQRKVRYQYGMLPNVTTPLRDNSALALPVTYTPDIISPTPLVAYATPVYIGRYSANSTTGVGSDFKHAWIDVPIGSSRGSRVVYFQATAGGVNTIATADTYFKFTAKMLVTPNVGTAKYAQRLNCHYDTGVSSGALWSVSDMGWWVVQFDADADSATTANIEVVVDENPFGGSVLAVYTFDQDLPSILPYQINWGTTKGAGVNNVTVQTDTILHGSILYATRTSQIFQTSDSLTVTRTGVSFANRFYETGPLNMGVGDASDTAAAAGTVSFTQGVPMGSAGEFMVVTTASFGAAPPVATPSFLGRFTTTNPLADAGQTFGVTLPSSGKQWSFIIVLKGNHPSQGIGGITVTPNVGSAKVNAGFVAKAANTNLQIIQVDLAADSVTATTANIKVTPVYDGTEPCSIAVYAVARSDRMTLSPLDAKGITVDGVNTLTISDLTTVNGGFVIAAADVIYDADGGTGTITSSDATFTEQVDINTPKPFVCAMATSVTGKNGNFTITANRTVTPPRMGLAAVSFR